MGLTLKGKQRFKTLPMNIEMKPDNNPRMIFTLVFDESWLFGWNHNHQKGISNRPPLKKSYLEINNSNSSIKWFFLENFWKIFITTISRPVTPFTNSILVLVVCCGMQYLVFCEKINVYPMKAATNKRRVNNFHFIQIQFKANRFFCWENDQ